jgi:hypothetical protein
VLAIILSLGAFAYRPATVIGMHGDALAQSLAGGDLVGTSHCTETGDGLWRCSISDNGGSGGANYVVHTHAFGCWDADRVGRGSVEGGTPATASGCITLLDELSWS